MSSARLRGGRGGPECVGFGEEQVAGGGKGAHARDEVDAALNSLGDKS